MIVAYKAYGIGDSSTYTYTNHNHSFHPNLSLNPTRTQLHPQPVSSSEFPTVTPTPSLVPAATLNPLKRTHIPESSSAVTWRVLAVQLAIIRQTYIHLTVCEATNVDVITGGDL